jgi:hypothetical protein
MALQWQIKTPCPSVRPSDNAPCEREATHAPPHWVTVWADVVGEDGAVESYPAYPETWADAPVADKEPIRS